MIESDLSTDVIFIFTYKSFIEPKCNLYVYSIMNVSCRGFRE